MWAYQEIKRNDDHACQNYFLVQWGGGDSNKAHGSLIQRLKISVLDLGGRDNGVYLTRLPWVPPLFSVLFYFWVQVSIKNSFQSPCTIHLWLHSHIELLPFFLEGNDLCLIIYSWQKHANYVFYFSAIFSK